MNHWFIVTKRASWDHLADVRQDFRHADLVGNLTVFNVGGNNYRIIAAVKYRWQIVYVRQVLTHEEYDRGNWREE